MYTYTHTSNITYTRRFRISCRMWTDPDGDEPLQYRFGYQQEGSDAQITWLSPTNRNFLSSVFPSGTITLYAAVLDSKGATSDVYMVSLLPTCALAVFILVPTYTYKTNKQTCTRTSRWCCFLSCRVLCRSVILVGASKFACFSWPWFFVSHNARHF
jgi:hypothetical protein